MLLQRLLCWHSYCLGWRVEFKVSSTLQRYDRDYNFNHFLDPIAVIFWTIPLKKEEKSFQGKIGQIDSIQTAIQFFFHSH